MSFFDPREIDLQEQVRMLGNEVASLRKAAASRGRNLYGQASETATDYYADIADAIRAALPGFRKRARAAESVALQNPAIVAAIGLVVIGLAASILFRRSAPTSSARAQAPERQRPARAAATTRGPSRTTSRKRTARPANATRAASNGEAAAPDTEA